MRVQLLGSYTLSNFHILLVPGIFTFYLFQAFRKGLNEYLNKFAYKNAFTEDLWDSLGKASGKPVREVMSTWTSKMGFPVLQVCNILITLW